MYAPNMKIYTGWVIDIAGSKWTVKGHQSIRKTQWVILESGDDRRSVRRIDLIGGLNDGSITYQGTA